MAANAPSPLEDATSVIVLGFHRGPITNQPIKFLTKSGNSQLLRFAIFPRKIEAKFRTFHSVISARRH